MATEEYFGTNYEVTDELVEQALGMIGMPVRTEGWNAEASRDSIRHYVMGLGDDNPLYTDPEYGRRSVWGTMLAPPTFVFTISDTGIVPGLAGLQPIQTGGEFTFERPIRMGESL
jgi:hypothetical protein